MDHRETVDTYWRAIDARDWPTLRGLLAPDVRYEVPQSSELVRGPEAVVRFNAEYPGAWRLSPLRIVADAQGAASWIDFRLDGESMTGLTFFTFDKAGRVATAIDFWPEPYERPADRAHLSELQ